MPDSLPERLVLKSRLRRRGIYLLPNLFTTAALFAGFYAIVQAMNGNFESSAVAVFIAMVLDGLDGRVARLTGTCLLYTSPSPRDRTRSRMPSSA